jgi:hypothetical protein
MEVSKKFHSSLCTKKHPFISSPDIDELDTMASLDIEKTSKKDHSYLMNYAFNENHASIIYSKEVLDQYNAIINTFDEKKGASSFRSGGYLQLH